MRPLLFHADKIKVMYSLHGDWEIKQMFEQRVLEQLIVQQAVKIVSLASLKTTGYIESFKPLIPV